MKTPQRTLARLSAHVLFLGATFSVAGCGGSGNASANGTGSGTSTSGASAASGSTGGTGTSATTGASTGSAASAGQGSTGSAASGGSAGSGGVPSTSLCAGAGTRALTLHDAFIDDFEEAVILPGWSSFNDVMPTPNSFQIMQVAGGALGTVHSGHYAGTGAKLSTAGGYGVGTVFNAAIDPGAGIYCIDISVFDGVSFWAKAATAGGTIALNFVLPNTNMASVDMMNRPNGGDCKTSCYKHPHVSVTLTASWAQYTVKFSDAAGGTAKVGTVIQELAWLSPDANWDFSLDEIAFYKGTPPAGPVGMGDGGAPGGSGSSSGSASSGSPGDGGTE